MAFFFIFVLFGVSLKAQTQNGSVAIAEAIEPASQDVVGNFTGCVKELAPTVGAKEALKACKEVSKVATDAAKRVANEAADATKASRPLVVFGDRYGRYNRGFYRRSVVYRRPVVRRVPRYHTPRYSRPQN